MNKYSSYRIAGTGRISGIWLVLCLVLSVSATVCAREPVGPRVGIIVSRDIRPYLVVASQVDNVLSQRTGAIIRTFSVEKQNGIKDRTLLEKRIRDENLDLIVTIGPEAMSFARAQLGGERIVYSMVLNPEGIWPDGCGVSLKIPVSRQITTIEAALPSLHRIGILYDPQYNDGFVKEAGENAGRSVKIVPLAVSLKEEISSVLEANWKNIDGLWLIPDLTVISEGIILHLIKKGLLEGVPVIGYNPFFYKNGAALSLILDYEDIGLQTAELCVTVMSGRTCRPAPPRFTTWINANIVKSLGLSVVVDPSLGIVEGP